MVGIDEAGRGCAAGPLVVVGLKLKNNIEGLNDSKKINKKKRQELFNLIKENSEYKIVSISSKEIDEKGISCCMKKALTEIKDFFKNEEIIFDGNTAYGVEGIKTLIKADSLVKEVSAASILAKETKDNELDELGKNYPEYDFKSHSAYLTKKHIEEIKKYGLSEIHRKSYNIKALQEH
jgi:ribonuclease HII